MHTLLYNFGKKNLFIGFAHFPLLFTCKSCGNAFWREESLPCETERNRDHLCNVCEKDFKSLPMDNQHIIWQHIGHVFVCNGCGKKFQTNISIHRRKKLLLVGQGQQLRRFRMWWEGGKKEDGSGQLQEEGRHPLPTSLKIHCDILKKKTQKNMSNTYLFK